MNREIRNLKRIVKEIEKEKSKEIKELTKELKALKNTVEKERSPVKIHNTEIFVKKAIISPQLSSKTVLTDSTWEYVKIYLNSKNQDKALFFWNQAQNFYESTKSLSLVSKPLTAYYCFLNATKALLEVKNINYDLFHGVTGKSENGHVNIINETVKYQPNGVVSALGIYLGEVVPHGGQEYKLKDIFYNLAYIHRAYILTYKNSTELFIPILNPRFVFDKYRNKAWFEATLEVEHSNTRTLNKLQGYSLDRFYKNQKYYTIRRNKTFDWVATRNKPTDNSKREIKSYYKKIRKELRYIYSTNQLWYIKRKDLITSNIIDKSTLTLTIGAMHRLSELSRYNPHILNKHLTKDASWLISEFINKSIYQFIDQISSEITGDDFRATGFRA